MSRKASYKTPRLYYADPLQPDTSISLSGNPHHYLRNVMRKNVGDHVRVFNAEHGEFLGEITHIGKKALELNITETIKPALDVQGNAPHITLALSPLAKDRMDMAVEKSCELGIHALQPLIMEHSNTRKVNEERITAQMVEAAEQCERLSLPALQTMMPLREWLASFDKAENPPCIFAAIEREDAAPLADICAQDNISNICFLIGPEGGFSDDEKAMLNASKHVHAVNLGNTILRAETAAIYGLSVLRAALPLYAI